MADIRDIKTILYTEKSLKLQEHGVVVIQTSPKMTKNGLKTVLKEYFGIVPLKINSLKMEGKVKRFRGRLGQRNDYKKFYVKLPEGVSLESSEA
ncbi:50S ribosomal protein L23 [uncultured Campylobacter sp.]|uniref:50S ribosomal protein L23 n=1 Tax=uncultured Campylobacter sp. TaxID=218934 RepID=UPI00261C4E42|nr:50S ribosomal protein L23 [uncultured Campylobacter sp.]